MATSFPNHAETATTHRSAAAAVGDHNDAVNYSKQHSVSNANDLPPTAHRAINRPSKILYMSYSPDTTCLSVGSSHGYEIYNIDKYGRFTLEFREILENDVIIVERLNNSALVCLVVDSHPCHMKVFHFRKQRTICQYSYSNKIKRILLNSRRVVVKTEDRLYVHGMKNLNIACSLKELPSDSDALALCPYEKRSFIAIPWAQDTGRVRIYDTNELTDVNHIDAHQSPLAQLKFDRHGNRLATASSKGTVVRVFDVQTRERVHELRRGVSHAVMYSLSFSPCGNFLAACSSANTVHIFKVPNVCTHDDSAAASAELEQQTDDGSSTVSSHGGGIISAISDMMKHTAGLVLPASEERSVAKIELDKSLTFRQYAILTYLEQGFYVVVTSFDGKISFYCVDPIKNFETVFVNEVLLAAVAGKGSSADQLRTLTVASVNAHTET